MAKQIERLTWKIYQDAPEYGCDDNPSFKWFGYGVASNGHIQRNIGPFETRAEAIAATA